jgi:tRNA-specific 2-thiouridylase
MTRFRIAVALSGGVDSAAAAALLKEQDHEVIGVHLRFCDVAPRCGGGKAKRSARAVAKHLGIPFVVWDLQDVFQQKVINPFFKEYRIGRTPSPCTVCNREIKFGVFLDRALDELKVDKVAMGHYARLARSEKQIADSEKRESIGHKPLAFSHKLLQGVDDKKDQSYFLWMLTREKLRHILFPIGEMTKEEVRAKAKEFDLPCAKRSESQGICFIGSENTGEFLRQQLPVEKGEIKNTKGEVIGEHDGVWFYTEGQRHGFSAQGGPASGWHTGRALPLYVIKKDVKTNTLIVGRGKKSEVSGFIVEKVNWINPAISNKQLAISKLGVRIRHLGEIIPVTIESGDSKPLAISHKLLAKLASPAFGVAPGQSAVFYNLSEAKLRRRGKSRDSYPDDEVLGGGVIEKIKSQN